MSIIKLTTRYYDESKKILSKIDREKKKRIIRFAALVRTTARRSIKFRKYKGSKTKKARPGKPPFTHVPSSTFGIRSIFFSWIPSIGSAIVGPKGLNRSKSVPAALEHGGTSETRLPKWLQKKTGKRTVTAQIEARPFMRPALAAVKNQYPQKWKDLF